MYKNLYFKLVFVSLVLLVGLFTALPLKKINMGLDLKGGMHLIYKVDTSGLSAKEKKGAAERAVEVIRNRIDELGVKEPVIQPQGTDRILIQLPGVVDREHALSIIGRTALLEFKLVEDNPDVIKKNRESVDSDHEWNTLEGKKILLKKKASLTGKSLSDAQVGFGNLGLSYVSIHFNSRDAKKFGEITEKNTGKRLAILLDGKVRLAPVIKEPIYSGEAQITGDFSPDEARDIALVLRSGALPCPLHVEEERTVGPLLGIDSIRRGVRATIFGLIAVSLFMAGYYLLAGIVCVLALGFNMVLILAGLNAFGATLTLPGIAGIILTLGMAVDANVLIYERIREELELKKPLSIALRLGYQKAFRTILDSNATTLIAAFFLLIFGTGPIKGFGVTLSLGILASMFTALVFTRVVFELLVSNGIIKSLPMFKFVRNPDFQFIKRIKICIVLSLTVIIAGAFYFVKGGQSNYGIDFAGGQVQEYKFHKEVKLDRLRGLLAKEGLEDFALYRYSSSNTVGIKSSADTYKKVKEVLDKDYKGEYDILRVDKVGPVVGRLLKKKALLAILFALLGILGYVTLRFHHFDFGSAAVIALFHDVFIAASFLLFFAYKFDLLIVTALLTIAGYSINDTIVVYDRIRELSTRFTKEPLPSIINRAINQTLSRTLITSLTTLLVVACLFYLGSQNLKGFSFALIVGFIAGTYSSVYIASPLVILFRKK